MPMKLVLYGFVVTTAWCFSACPQTTTDDDPSGELAPELQLESRQGQPDQPYTIGHRHIAKGTRLKCYLVEHDPKQADDSADCLVRRLQIQR